MPRVWTIVVAAGRGSRFGKPKQFELLAGRRVLDWSVAAAAEVSDGVVVVYPPDAVEPGGVPGGETRSQSVRAGLAAVADDATIVLVHDAARPLAKKPLFDRAVSAIEAGADAAVPVVPVTDTIRTRGGTNIDRSMLLIVQTPQAFDAAALRAAHRSQPEGTDDAGLIENAGGRVAEVEGDPCNIKITHPTDLIVAAALMEGE